ncbi:MAG: hypothetical protein HY216_09995 [Candidatus Rokubacteria bacterium]|nr:hypothetical protein [Candidatus Rokubacteria bacterium]
MTVAPLPFPYLCDPERVAAQAWGLKSRGHSARGYLRRPAPPMSRPTWRVTPVPGVLHRRSRA